MVICMVIASIGLVAFAYLFISAAGNIDIVLMSALLESVEFDHSKSGGISPNWSINNSQMAVKRASQK